MTPKGQGRAPIIFSCTVVGVCVVVVVVIVVVFKLLRLVEICILTSAL